MLVNRHLTSPQIAPITMVFSQEQPSTALTTHLLTHPELLPLWETSTKTHSFLTSLSNNTLKSTQFNKWLIQDYIFAVHPFTYILRHLHGLTLSVHEDDSAYGHFKTLLEQGLSSSEKEVVFFRSLAERRKVILPDVSSGIRGTGDYLGAIRNASTDLAQLASPALREYSEYLLDPDLRGDLEELALKLWVLEKCYCDAWKNVQDGLGKLGDQEVDDTIQYACSWWVNKGFEEYVGELGSVIDQFGTGEVGRKLDWVKAENVCKRVLELEEGFWGMAFGSGAEVDKME